MAKLTITAKDVVTISRYWHEPAIRTVVTSEGISLSTPVEDFLTALAQEMGPTAAMTRASLTKKLLAALPNVLNRIKEESIKVV